MRKTSHVAQIGKNRFQKAQSGIHVSEILSQHYIQGQNAGQTTSIIYPGENHAQTQRQKMSTCTYADPFSWSIVAKLFRC
ncbi:hypothetical protein SAMN05421878_1121 [Actinobaculum suis]|uniref:Uncharacterized protein n=1 Tax=Actinobaculum suis TaxID=1657 RepID=A0A1G7DLK3_9ACTO|nr:hypothetical protein SAMN05421878_1121 [Actinobaculum suis]